MSPPNETPQITALGQSRVVEQLIDMVRPADRICRAEHASSPGSPGSERVSTRHCAGQRVDCRPHPFPASLNSRDQHDGRAASDVNHHFDRVCNLSSSRGLPVFSVC